jgi:hypothetical protein
MLTGMQRELSGRTTILEAVVKVVDQVPRTAAEIHALIVSRGLFAFKAQDPVAMVRAAIRKHLSAHGGDGQPAALLLAVDRDRFRKA